MTRFPIGRTDTAPLHIDVNRLIDSRALVQANSGGGKSWLLRLIAEGSAGHVPILILDPEGEFATLREKYDFALVGRDGEMPVDLHSAELLARKLVEFRVSAIINLSDLDSLDHKREYVRLFLQALIAMPRKHWGPTLVMLDEAHRFAPKQGGEADSTQALITLMDAGRKRGFCGIVATQRLAKLHNDVIAEANNVFIGRTWLDNDQERAGDTLGLKKADRTILRELAQGEFFAFGPALSIPGVSRFRSASVATTHPKPGQRHQMAVPKASAHIHEIIEQLGDVPRQAAEEIAGLDLAHKRIRELELELRQRPVQVQPKVERVVERIEVPIHIFKDGEVKRLEAAVVGLTGVAAQFTTFGSQLTASVSEVSTALKAASARPPLPASPSRPTPPVAAVTVSRPLTTTPSTNGLPRAERKVLSVLAQYPQGRTKTQVAILAGYAVNGGGFNNAISALRSRGLLSGYKDNLAITALGLETLGEWEPLPQGRELVDYWLKELPKAERAILGVLVHVYPASLSKTDIAERADYDARGGGFNNALSRLRTLELVSGRNELRASDSFFIKEQV